MGQSVSSDAGFRIGPNAIIQTGYALRAAAGAAIERQVFESAGLAHYLAAAPEQMIPQVQAVALFDGLYAHRGLGGGQAQEIARTAGLLTGDYILANRIPLAAQHLLHVLPGPVAARVLLAAISKHAWTFAGSGLVSCRYGKPLVLEITGNPLARAGCPWHCAVFERLFSVILARAVSVEHTRCCAAGDPACRFVIHV